MKKRKKIASVIPIASLLIIIILSSTSVISGSRSNPDIIYNIALENREIAESVLHGPPTQETELLRGRAINIACEIAYIGKQLPGKYIKSREVACETLDILGVNCWTECDR